MGRLTALAAILMACINWCITCYLLQLKYVLSLVRILNRAMGLIHPILPQHMPKKKRWKF